MAQPVELDLADLRALNGGFSGVSDAPCPVCGPSRRSPVNRLRKVLRIWDEGDFVTYACARCGISGWAHDRSASGASPAPRTRPVVPPPQAKDRSDLARFLWASAEPLLGSPAETYLRGRQCFLTSDSLRFLPAKGDYPPSMIARFGSGHVAGIHLTRLRADGSGKAGTDKDKMMIGHTLGEPIIVHENPERTELMVSEGIEDAASLALATGWTCWAAGAASRIPATLATARGFERVYLAVDHDLAGSKALAKATAVRPDAVPVRIAKALGVVGRLDANAALQRYGADALLAVIEWSDAFARMERGEIGFHRMQAETARAQGIFNDIAAKRDMKP